MGYEEPEIKNLPPLEEPSFSSGKFLGDHCNCAYTTADGKNIKFSIDVLAKLMQEIPEPPKILIMDIKAFMNPHLMGNFIILSKDVGEALEKAIAENIK